jgi:hypothetical protein
MKRYNGIRVRFFSNNNLWYYIPLGCKNKICTPSFNTKEEAIQDTEDFGYYTKFFY